MSRTTRIPRTIALLTPILALCTLVGCGSWGSDTNTAVVDHGTVTEKSGSETKWLAATPDLYGQVCRQAPVLKASWSKQLASSVQPQPGHWSKPNPKPKSNPKPDDQDPGTHKQPKGPDLNKPSSPSKAPGTNSPQGSTKEVCERGVIQKGIPGHWSGNHRVIELKDKKGDKTRWRVSEAVWQKAEVTAYFDLRKTGSEPL